MRDTAGGGAIQGRPGRPRTGHSLTPPTAVRRPIPVVRTASGGVAEDRPGLHGARRRTIPRCSSTRRAGAIASAATAMSTTNAQPPTSRVAAAGPIPQHSPGGCLRASVVDRIDGPERRAKGPRTARRHPGGASRYHRPASEPRPRAAAPHRSARASPSPRSPPAVLPPAPSRGLASRLGNGVWGLLTSVDFAVLQIIVLALFAVVGMTLRQLPGFAFRSPTDYANEMDKLHALYDPVLGAGRRRRARAAPAVPRVHARPGSAWGWSS